MDGMACAYLFLHPYCTVHIMLNIKYVTCLSVLDKITQEYHSHEIYISNKLNLLNRMLQGSQTACYCLILEEVPCFASLRYPLNDLVEA